MRVGKAGIGLQERVKKSIIKQDRLTAQCEAVGFENQCVSGLAKQKNEAFKLRVKVLLLKKNLSKSADFCRSVRGKTEHQARGISSGSVGKDVYGREARQEIGRGRARDKAAKGSCRSTVSCIGWRVSSSPE